MFRSLQIPEAQSEGASNITMHQLLRLCYADQRSPAGRLFRYESFDKHAIREAVGDLLCGLSGYEIYEIGLALRDLQSELSDIQTELAGLLRALPSDEAIRTPQLINSQIRDLESEKSQLLVEIEGVDHAVAAGEVREYLQERGKLKGKVSRQRNDVAQLEARIEKAELELREVEEFQEYLNEVTEKLELAERTFQAIGTIEFTHCPACGAVLHEDTPDNHCVVCSQPTDPDNEQARYNQIRLDLEIQSRESKQLGNQKGQEVEQAKRELRRAKRSHSQALTDFELKFAGANGPREAYLAERTNRIGHIEAEIGFLTRNLETAEEIEELTSRKESLSAQIAQLKDREEDLQRLADDRRRVALNSVAGIGASILRDDCDRQEEFEAANRVEVNFWDDSISVDGRLNFAESSNVFLKNTAILSLFLAAGTDDKFYHPQFLLLDNMEDKGMEEERSHLFQRLVVERSTELEVPFQVIFTTSMMNPKLELDDYTIGPAYTSVRKTLTLERDSDVLITDAVFNNLYKDLSAQAKRMLEKYPSPIGFEPSDLVGETVVRMLTEGTLPKTSELHLRALAARAMHRVLMDSIRSYVGRSDTPARISIEEMDLPVEQGSVDLLDLGRALEQLASIEPRQASVVQMRYFAGMTFDEIALELGRSSSTINRDWSLAREWLMSEVLDANNAEKSGS